MSKSRDKKRAEKIAQEYVGQLTTNLSFKKDLEEFSSLQSHQLNEYIKFLNTSTLKKPLGDTAFLRRIKLESETIDSIHDILSFFVKLINKDKQLYNAVLKELLTKEVLSNTEYNRIKKTIASITPFMDMSAKKKEINFYKKKLAPSYERILTMCKLRVQFKNDFSRIDEEYNAVGDVADIFPVADIEIKIKDKDKTQSFIFQADNYDIEEIMKVLRFTKCQLTEISKRVKLKK